MMTILADIPPLVNEGGQATATGVWLLIAVGVIFGAAGGVNQILGVIANARKLYGRKPTADEDLRSQGQILADLKTSLAGLAPNEKVDKLVAQLGSFATQDQIRSIELQLPALISREEMERCLVKLEKDQDARNKELSAYMHNAVHDLRGELQAMRLASDEGREGIHERFNALVKVTYEMRGMLIASEAKS